MFRRAAALVILGVSGISAAWGQHTGPRLMARLDKQEVPVVLTRLRIDARIEGAVAETRMTMTFHNPNSRVLEGELVVPLPMGAVVSGYALDVDGAMVDGVIVEKERARAVFEEIERRGVDPGLIEWAGGANFRTRVYPVRSHGERTVMVRFVGELLDRGAALAYRVPLALPDPVESFSLRIEVVRPAVAPRIETSGPVPLDFGPWRENFVAEASLAHARLDQDLEFTLPPASARAVTVEKDSDGEYYFCITEGPRAPRRGENGAPQPRPARVTLFWDASASRGEVSHERELGLLERFFAAFRSGRIDVDLIVFRNAAAPAQHFVSENGRADRLLAALRTIAYDGATQLGAVSHAADRGGRDLHLLFTDGLSNFGADEPGDVDGPVYVVSDDPRADHAALRELADRTGGAYFNLREVDDEAAVGGIGRPPLRVLGADVAGPAGAILPAAGAPVTGRTILVGRLDGPRAKVVVRWGAAGRTVATKTFEVSRTGAVDGELLKTLWGQKKVDQLMAHPRRNRQELVEVGRRFGLVTPGTSLLVLDNVDQYLRYEIEPPATKPEWRRAYSDAMARATARKERGQREHVDRVLAMWRERVKWWQTKFDPSAAGAPGPDAPAAPPGIAAPQAVRSPAPEVAGEDRLERRVPAGVPGGVVGGVVGGLAGRAEFKKLGAADRDFSMAVDGVSNVDPDNGRLAAPRADAAVIHVKPWDSTAPYLATLRKAPDQDLVAEYYGQRRAYGDSPAFFLDCADYLIERGQLALALQALSNIAELSLEDAALLGVLAHRLAQLGRLDLAAGVFERVLDLRPEEPQSWRDLALVLAQQKNYPRAIELLSHVVMNAWDRFEGIEVIALSELNQLLPAAEAAGCTAASLDPRFVQRLDVDVRVVLTWDADNTDIDLWVIEPNGEKAFYGRPLTRIGGRMSRDVTDGYGPEEYLLRRAPEGKFTIRANYYGTRAQKVLAPVTLQATLFTNYGRPGEQRRSITLRLDEKRQVVDVGEIDFAPSR